MCDHTWAWYEIAWMACQSQFIPKKEKRKKKKEKKNHANLAMIIAMSYPFIRTEFKSPTDDTVGVCPRRPFGCLQNRSRFQKWTIRPPFLYWHISFESNIFTYYGTHTNAWLLQTNHKLRHKCVNFDVWHIRTLWCIFILGKYYRDWAPQFANRRMHVATGYSWLDIRHAIHRIRWFDLSWIIEILNSQYYFWYSWTFIIFV